MLDTGCSMLDTGYQILSIKHQVSKYAKTSSNSPLSKGVRGLFMSLLLD
jgi:hypothetical protein